MACAPDAALAGCGGVGERVLEKGGAARRQARVVAQLDGKAVVGVQRGEVHVGLGAAEEAACVSLHVQPHAHSQPPHRLPPLPHHHTHD